MSYDVAIIGCGRVGLPLALAFADHGLRTLGIENDPERLEAVRDAPDAVRGGPGADEVMRRVDIAWSERAADAAQADAIVLTLGTPSFSHIEIDMRDIRSVLDDLLPVLRPGHLLVLRSTIAPRTTEFVAGYIEKHLDLKVGRDVFVAHVPERIAAGRFFEEIGSLPCIVGGVGEASGAAAGALFEPLGAPIVQTTPVEAELAKIWTNILRYAMFALPNRLMMECEQYDANVFEVIELINRDYPRGGMPQPGFTAGTCLRKDFTFSEERSPAPGMLLAVSRVHESVPLFIVEGLKRRLGSLRGRKVAVLGAGLQGRHRRRARLARAQAHPPARARAGRRGGPRSARGHADAVLRRGGPRRRRGGHRHQPQRVPRPPGAGRDRRQRQGRRRAGRSVGLLRHQARLQPSGGWIWGVTSQSTELRKRHAHSPNPVTPRDLLALGDGAPVVGDRDLVQADTWDLQHLGGDLGLEAEVIADEADPTNQVTAEGFVAHFHITDRGIEEDIGEQREEAVPRVVPEEVCALRLATP